MKVNSRLFGLFLASTLVSIFVCSCSNTVISPKSNTSDLPSSERTNEELINKFQAQNDKLLQDLKDIGKLLAQFPAKDSAVKEKLNPIPRNTSEKTANIELVMEPMLKDPYTYTTNFNKHVEPDVSVGYALIAWQINAFKDIKTASAKQVGDRAIKVNEETLETGAPRYIAVIRTENYNSPTLTNDNQFHKGDLRYRVFLVDLAHKKVLASCSGKAESSNELTAEMKADDTDDRKKEILKTDLKTNAQIAIAEQLAKLTGGDIDKPSHQSVYYH
jgi:hypothetical protein